MSDAPRNAKEAASYLKGQITSGSHAWQSLCLKLQRVARGLPAVYPSAVTAARATPESERVEKFDGLKFGMVAYSDHPTDSNEFGHIYFIAGRKKGYKLSDPDGILTLTNLADGSVGVVPLSFYLRSWGDPFQFGATWLNGYNFAEFDKPPVSERGDLGENYQHAMEDVRKAIRFHEGKGHTRLVTALKRDLERMENRWANWKR